jgi:hypothetical protein
MHNWWLLPKILIAYPAPNSFDFDIDNLCGPKSFSSRKPYLAVIKKSNNQPTLAKT